MEQYMCGFLFKSNAYYFCEVDPSNDLTDDDRLLVARHFTKFIFKENKGEGFLENGLDLLADVVNTKMHKASAFHYMSIDQISIYDMDTYEIYDFENFEFDKIHYTKFTFDV